MVIDDRYGLIVNEKDVKALVLAINKLLEDRTLLENFSKNIQEDYTIGARSWHEIAKALVGEYNKM